MSAWIYEPPKPQIEKYQIEDIVARVSMEAVASRYGFDVIKGKIVCPFHNDTNPSCFVYPEKRGFYCFACGAGGSVIDFISRLFGLGFYEAAEQLDTDLGLGVTGVHVDVQKAAEWKRQNDNKAALREAVAREGYNRAMAAMAIRRLARPLSHRKAAVYASERGVLEYLEYLAEESVYPEG